MKHSRPVVEYLNMPQYAKAALVSHANLLINILSRNWLIFM